MSGRDKLCECSCRALPPDALEVAKRLPPGLWPRLKRVLNQERGLQGTGRRIEIDLALDEKGEPTRIGTLVRPPHLWV